MAWSSKDEDQIQGVITKTLTKGTDYSGYVKPIWGVKKNAVLTGGQIDISAPGRSVFTFREYIADVICAPNGAFTLQSYYIQPGDPRTFPWLSSIACNFEQYDLHGCVFEYRSMSGDPMSSTNTAVGSVFMATQYDSTKPAFVNKMQIENHQYSMSAKPTYNMIHPVECDRSQSTLSELYITQTYPTGQSDPRMYYLGTLYIGSQGTQSSTAFTMGELWSNYTVELLKPRMITTGPNTELVSHWAYNGTGISTSAYFGTPIQASGSNLTVTLTGTTITLTGISSGNYLIFYYVTGTYVSTTSITFTATTNCSFSQMWVNDTAGMISSPSGITNSSTVSTLGVLKVTGSSPVVTLSGGVFPAPTTSMDLYITSVSSTVATLPAAKDEIKDIMCNIKCLRGKFETSISSKLSQ